MALFIIFEKLPVYLGWHAGKIAKQKKVTYLYNKNWLTLKLHPFLK